jgi:hypothetical protein
MPIGEQLHKHQQKREDADDVMPVHREQAPRLVPLRL